MSGTEGKKDLKIMCDYCAEGIWLNGASVSPYDLPLSKDVADRLIQWNGYYDAGIVESGLTLEQFDAIGLGLARQVKKELPDWTVNFFDEGALLRATKQEEETGQKKDRNQFLYEITQGG